MYSEHLEGFSTVPLWNSGTVVNSFWLMRIGCLQLAIGPMALEVTCRVEGAGTRLQIRQSGADDSTRWKRYNTLIEAGWKDSLAALKQYLENGAEPRLPPRGVATRR